MIIFCSLFGKHIHFCDVWTIFMMATKDHIDLSYGQLIKFPALGFMDFRGNEAHFCWAKSSGLPLRSARSSFLKDPQLVTLIGKIEQFGFSEFLPSLCGHFARAFFRPKWPDWPAAFGRNLLYIRSNFVLWKHYFSIEDFSMKSEGCMASHFWLWTLKSCRQRPEELSKCWKLIY